MSGEIVMKRMKRESAAELKILGSIVQPEVLHRAVPRLADVQEARVERKNINRQMQLFSQFSKGGSLQHVAQIDQSVWSAILQIFAKTDPETGAFEDDGLLYKEDFRGNVVINRPFFYMLIEYLTSCGYKVDMRTTTRLV